MQSVVSVLCRTVNNNKEKSIIKQGPAEVYHVSLCSCVKIRSKFKKVKHKQLKVKVEPWVFPLNGADSLRI